MDEFSKPTSWSDVRLVTMTVVTIPSVSQKPVRAMDRIKTCKTLAQSLDEALARARSLYGPITLNAWGAMLWPIPEDRVIYGGGYFIPSRHDAEYREALKRLAISWPRK